MILDLIHEIQAGTVHLTCSGRADDEGLLALGATRHGSGGMN